MIDNYNVIELLKVYETTDNEIIDIINEIEKTGILKGTKI